ncbi:hypothetical protein [Burkholderia stabilis]|uniref:hypothetical protein n=1 Tax=Burkholderia stabilis TaxID=95485 RepID=UPI001588AF22|nr:hypothetical protein [Burkholderia stabilis]
MRDTIPNRFLASAQILMRLLFSCVGFHRFDRKCRGATEALRRSSAIAAIRQQALANGQAPGLPKAAAVLAA